MVPNAIHQPHVTSPWREATVRAVLSLAATAVLAAGGMSLVIARLAATSTDIGEWSAMAAARLVPAALTASVASGVLAALICSARQTRSTAVRGFAIYALAMVLLSLVSVASVGWHWSALASLVGYTAPGALVALIGWGQRHA